jgi:hypothetical protein
MTDGVGMFVASLGERVKEALSTSVYVGIIRLADSAPTVGGKPRVIVQVDNGDMISLTWVSSSVWSQMASGNVVGLEIQIVSNDGQWAGVEILIPCGKA